MSHRRPHKKSRLGCCECKRRHIKCDEARPKCASCIACDHACVYLQPTRRNARRASVSPAQRRSFFSNTDAAGSTSTPTSSAANSGISSPDLSTPSSFAPSADSVGLRSVCDTRTNILDPPLNMRHMKLFIHFITVTGPGLMEQKTSDPDLMHIAIAAALSSPCLMHEILALSALHLSHLSTDQAQSYRDEAIALQNEALYLFSITKTDITAENCSAILIFTSLLGLHALADAVVVLETSADGFLDKFVTYLNLHRGVRVITSQAWSLLKQSNVAAMLNRAESTLQTASLQGRSRTVSDHLNKLLATDGMSIECRNACSDAVAHLVLIYQLEPSPGELLSNLQQSASGLIWTWPVLLTGVFTDLLMQRRPEALIILCHYAVLLHNHRHLWFVGAAGVALIESITSFLGTYWREWLAWPNEILAANP